MVPKKLLYVVFEVINSSISSQFSYNYMETHNISGIYEFAKKATREYNRK